jgi:hypothetical protein
MEVERSGVPSGSIPMSLRIGKEIKIVEGKEWFFYFVIPVI